MDHSHDVRWELIVLWSPLESGMPCSFSCLWWLSVFCLVHVLRGQFVSPSLAFLSALGISTSPYQVMVCDWESFGSTFMSLELEILWVWVWGSLHLTDMALDRVLTFSSASEGWRLLHEEPAAQVPLSWSVTVPDAVPLFRPSSSASALCWAQRLTTEHDRIK